MMADCSQKVNGRAIRSSSLGLSSRKTACGFYYSQALGPSSLRIISFTSSWVLPTEDAIMLMETLFL